MLGLAAAHPARAQSGTVVMYAYPGAHNDLIVSHFQRKHPNIRLRIITGQGPQMHARLIAESSNPQADVVDASVEDLMSRPDLYEAHESPNRSAFPDWAVVRHDGKTMGYGFTITMQCLAINTREMSLDQAPKSWEDILDDRYKGKFMIGNPALSKGGLDTFMIIHTMFGEDGVRKLSQNGLFAPQTNIVPQSLGRGEIAFGLVEETKTQQLIDEGFPIALRYPTEGITPTTSMMALVRNRPNKENGKLLLDFITSREGLNLNVEGRNRRVPRADCNPPQNLPPMSEIRVNPAVPAEAMVTDTDKVVAIFNRYYTGR
jgi:iron(III) transport system substrate-binding protein